MSVTPVQFFPPSGFQFEEDSRLDYKILRIPTDFENISMGIYAEHGPAGNPSHTPALFAPLERKSRARSRARHRPRTPGNALDAHIFVNNHQFGDMRVGGKGNQQMTGILLNQLRLKPGAWLLLQQLLCYNHSYAKNH